jgi:hypothetical protein
MSRKLFSSGSPRRRGTFRPQFEVLEDRLPPGGLNGGPDHSGHDRGDDMAEHRRENDDRDRTIRTTSGLVDFDTHTIALPGSTTLTRTEEGISAHFHATGLISGHAYTFWIVEVQPDGFAHGGRVAGHVAGPSGVVNVSVEAEVGQILGDFHVPGTPIQVGPLRDPLHSEFRLVIRDHGPASSNPAALFQQLHTHQTDVPGVTDYAISFHVPPS